MGNHAEYYKEALRYLGCMKMEDISGNISIDFVCLFCSV